MKFGKIAGFACAAALLLSARAFAADWQDGAPAEWKQLIEAAKKESPIVVAASPEFGKPMAEAFEKDTGLKMDFVGGAYNELEARFVREARAKNETIDIYFGGGTSINYVKEGILEPIGPMLILPSVKDPKNWRDGKLKFEDEAGFNLLIPNEYIHGWPLFDSNVVKPGMIDSWQDLLKPEWKGKIAGYDPTVPGPGTAVASFLAHMFGVDYVKKLYDGQDVKLTRNPRQLVEWVARGTYPVALAALATHIEAFKKEGITNLLVPTMKDAPGTLLGGSSLPLTAKGTPHPSAVKVFINWYASQRGQQVFTDTWATPSRRIDVVPNGVPDYVVPKPGLNYFDQYTESFYMGDRPKIIKAITDTLGR
jgi:ABC-type Fe3+ transport system substrate-binding protein